MKRLTLTQLDESRKASEDRGALLKKAVSSGLTDADEALLKSIEDNLARYDTSINSLRAEIAEHKAELKRIKSAVPITGMFEQ